MGFFKRIKESLGISVGKGMDSSLNSIALRYPTLENSAFWACTIQLSRIMATLPIHVYRQHNGSRITDRSSYLAILLDNPCPYMTSYQWRFVMAFNLEMFGKAMAIIRRKGKKPIALLPVSPNSMAADWKDNRLFYRYNGTELVSADDVLVISALPIGITGVLSPVEYAKSDAEVYKNSQKLQNNFFKQGTTIGGILTVPRGTSADIKKALSNLIQSQYSGSNNSYKTMIIEDSMKYEAIRLSERDTNTMIEAQKWTTAEVARRFGVPASFIGDRSSGGTYANIEQEMMNLVIYAIQPRAIALEHGLDSLCEGEQYIKIDLKGLLRGDHATRSAFYHNAIMDGWMSINEVRGLEDMDPVKGGNEHFFPANYTKIGDVGKNLNPYGLGEKREQDRDLEEKTLTEEKYVESVLSEAKSARKSIEAVMRRQLKQCIEELRRLSSEGQGNIGAEFRSFVQDHSDDWGKEYAPLYIKLASSLEPSIRKIAKVDTKIDASSIEAYSGKMAIGAASRFAMNRADEVDKAIEDGEELETLSTSWAEKPSLESHDEGQRAVNAMSLFVMTELHIEFMHVKADSDACEFCSKLDGKTVEVNGVVLSKGSDVEDGYGNVRHISKNYKHPPWHSHCSCIVVPGKGES